MKRLGGHVATIELSLFVVIYAMQGVVVAYLINFNKLYMTAAGVDARLAGWVETVVLITLVFKFLFGPLSDAVSPFGLGHRLPYIIFGIVLQTAGLLLLGAVNPAHALAAYAAAALLAVLGLALYDTCCDGMVVDVTPPADRARVQAALQVARFLATMICTYGFGRWISVTGLGPGKSGGVIWSCAALGAIPLILALSSRERPLHPDLIEDRFDWRALRVMLRPRALALLGFGASYGIIGLGVEFNLSPFYDHLGLGAGDLGTCAAVRYLGRAAGAVLMSTAGRRLGRRGRIATGLIALATTTALQATVVGSASAAAGAFVFGVANGWNDALFCVLAMELSDPRIAASTFALFMAISNLAALGDGLFGEARNLFDGAFRPVFVLFAALALVILGFVPILASRHDTARDLDDATQPSPNPSAHGAHAGADA